MSDKPVRKSLFKAPFSIYESKPQPAVQAPRTDALAADVQKEIIASFETNELVLPDVSERQTANIPQVSTVNEGLSSDYAQTPLSQPVPYSNQGLVSPASPKLTKPLAPNFTRPLAPPSQPLRPTAPPNQVFAPLPNAVRSSVINVSGSQKRLKIFKKRSRLINVLLLFCLLTPFFTLVAEGLNIYIIYSYAHDGVQHLLHVKDVFTGLKAHPTGFFDINKLHLAQQDFILARDDFQRLKDELEQDPLVNVTASILPQQITSAHALSQIGVDVTEMGQQLASMAIKLSPSLQGSLLTDTKKPLVTPTTISLLRSTIKYLLPRINDIQAQSRALSLDTLPISATQKHQMTQLIQALPQAQVDISQVSNLMDAASWILGVNAPRVLLVQTMDRAELRPTGGFTGQFGELQINAGRVAPFTLKNIGPLEEGNANSLANGQLPPASYRSWWPIANWGLRDSNLSADFPTSARIAISTYKYEFNHQVDGVVLFSPFLIARVLQVTGPITIPAYQETITAQNLEERLHYYQLDNVAIRKEEIIERVEDPNIARKLFTSNLAKLLMDHVRRAPPDELIAISRAMLHALRTKDLQIYVNNPQIEDLLVKYGAAALLDRSDTYDGLYVVQANVSASKASQYVRTNIHDTVTLDAVGGATHVMQMRLVYNQIGQVYGLDTYRDYVRIYVPKNSKLLWGDGFDTGTPLCGGPYTACPTYDVYQTGALLCPPGGAVAGAATNMFNDPYAGRNHPLDTIGAPTNTTSDEPGRAMFAGWVVIPKNCSLTVSLSWYVPPLGTQPYSLVIQRQSSTFPEVDVTIVPTPDSCQKLGTPSRHFEGILTQGDITLSLASVRASRQSVTSCYPQQKV